MPFAEHELAVVDHVGRLVEFWNFKKQMGRAWCVLYLSTKPLAADEVSAHLSISAGMTNMTLNALIGWGVVRKVWRPGERRNFYDAETRPWRMISQVLERREFQEIDRVVELLLEVTARFEAEGRTNDFRARRLGALLELAQQGRQILVDVLHLSLVRTGPLQSLSVKLAAGYLRKQARKAAGRKGAPEAAREVVEEDEAYSDDEMAVIDQIGSLIELWGFGRIMGRIWASLYLASSPLSSEAIQNRLSISSGLANTMVNALLRWGVVHKVIVPGERRTYYAAETDPWRMISRVLRQREHRRIAQAIEVCEDALEHYPKKPTDKEESLRKRQI